MSTAILSKILDGQEVLLIHQTVVWYTCWPFSEHVLLVVFALSNVDLHTGNSDLFDSKNGTQVRGNPNISAQARFMYDSKTHSQEYLDTSPHPSSGVLSVA